MNISIRVASAGNTKKADSILAEQVPGKMQRGTMQAPSVKMKFNGILNRHGRHATRHGFNLSAAAINIKSLLRHTRISLARILHPRFYGGARSDAPRICVLF